MSRRWFWPLIAAATLLLSVSSGFLWAVAVLYAHNPDPLPLRVTPDSTIHVVYYVDVEPWHYVAATLVALLGIALLFVAARLR